VDIYYLIPIFLHCIISCSVYGAQLLCVYLSIYTEVSSRIYPSVDKWCSRPQTNLNLVLTAIRSLYPAR